MYKKLVELKNILFDKKDKSVTKQVIKNSIYNSASNLVAKLGGLIFSIILARVLLPELFGVYTLALTLILTALTITDIGINSAISRYLAESLNKGKRGQIEARSVLRFLLKIRVSISFVAAILLFTLSNFIAEFFFRKPELVIPLKIGAIYLFVISLQIFFSYIFFSMKKLKYNLIIEFIYQAVRIILFLILIYFFNNITIAFWTLSIGALISLIVAYLIVNKQYNFVLYGKTVPITRKKVVFFMGWATLLYSIQAIFNSMDTFFLGRYMDTTYISYYAIILSSVGIIMSLLGITNLFIPVFLEFKGQRLKENFKRVINMGLLLSSSSAVVAMILVIPIVKLFYGSSYVPTQYLLPLIITTILLSLLIIETFMTGIYNSLFISKVSAKIPALIMIFMLAWSILLNYILIKFTLGFGGAWPLVGVALATTLARYSNLFALILVKNKMQKDW